MDTIKSFCTEQSQTDYRNFDTGITVIFVYLFVCKIYCSGNGGYFPGSLDLRSVTEYFLSPLGNKRSKMLWFVSSHAE